MADDTRIGIHVDADGAVRQIRLTNAELAKLADQSVKSGATLKRLVAPETITQFNKAQAAVTQMHTATMASTPGLGRLQNQLSNVAIALAGIPGPAGRVASSLGMFAVGGGVTVAVVAGIAAMTMAWRAHTAEGRRAIEMMDKLREKEVGMTEAALRARLADHRDREANLVAGREAFGGPRLDNSITGSNRRAADLEKTRKAIAAIGLALMDLDKEANKEALAKSMDEAKDALALYNEQHMTFAKNYAKDLVERRKLEADAAKERLDALAEEERLYDSGAYEEHLAAEAQAAFNEELREEMRIRQDITAELKEQRDVLLGLVTSSAARSASLVGGQAGTLLQGAAQGAERGSQYGPWGAAAGSVRGLQDAILGLAQSAKEARKQLAIVRHEYRASLDEYEFMASGPSSFQQSMRAAAQEFERMRQALIATQPSAEHYRIELAQLEAAYRANTAAIEANRAAQDEAIIQDAQVRILRALGRTEEAEALAIALANERELAQAREDGASKTAIAAIEEAQRVEAIGRAMDRIRAKIDSLTGTITGLEDFRNSLLLNDPTLSPTARLSEARSQYDAIMALAMGGDQAAAGRLPAAAQALLDASRAVNASGPGYQSDLTRILADNQDVINKFQDLRTIEEEMLLQLQLIATNTGQMIDAPFDFEPIAVPLGNILTEMQASVRVLQAGFQQNVDVLGPKLDRIAAAAESQEAMT